MWVEMWSLEAWKPSLYCMARAFQTMPSGCQPPIDSPVRRADAGRAEVLVGLAVPLVDLDERLELRDSLSRQSVPMPVAEVCEAQMPSCSFR